MQTEIKDVKDNKDDVEDNEVISIYTDGSVSGNGKNGAVGGIGVYSRQLNLSISKCIGPATNNIAELAAILEALRIVKDLGTNRQVHIFSDSQYSINCIKIWSKKWDENGWKTAKGKTVINKALIQECIAIYKTFDSVVIRHVTAHTGVSGNEQADLLAKKCGGVK